LNAMCNAMARRLKPMLDKPTTALLEQHGAFSFY
jgi:hypothetical protein